MGLLVVAPAPGVPVLGPSGASAHLRGIVWAAHRAGLGPRLVAAAASDRRGVHGAVPVPIEAASPTGWPSWLRPYRERREAIVAWKLARLALRGPATALTYERWSLFADVGARVREATGAPWVLEVNAPLLLERQRYEEVIDPAYAARAQARALRGADRLVAVSAWVARWLVEEVGVEPARVRRVPNGVEAATVDREALRAELGLEGRFVVGFLGSMKPWHGAERLAAVLDALPDALGLAVGGDPPARLAAHPRARCVGQVDEARAAQLVAAMDVGLAPYPADAPPWFCPLKVAAYRAQGTPVVATDVGELRELVGSGGEVVEDSDAALAAACRRWEGRRAAPLVRTWDAVLAESIEGLPR